VATFTHLTGRDYRSMPWKNGGGTTTEIAVEPDGAGGFLWRLSIADVAASGPFSDFGGHDRTILLLDGPGFILHFAEAPSRRVDRRLEPFTFDGGWRAECELVDGPVRDLNMMTSRSKFDGWLRVLRLGRGERIQELLAEVGLVHLIEGTVEAGAFRLLAGDTLRADGCRDELLAITASTDAVAVLVTLRRKDQDRK